MARTAMAWIINELRRKVRDMGPESLDSSIAMLGDTVRLKCTYYNLTSTAINPTTPKINIWNPNVAVVVSNATPISSTATGVRYYDYKVSTSQPEGIYRAEFSGYLGSAYSVFPYEFEVRRTQRIWSDDELQNYLDRYRIFIGDGEIREKLRNDTSFKRFLSDYDTFEWATLYDGDGSSDAEVTPTTSNLVNGEWTFSTAQSSSLYLEGHAYRIALAAAECLEDLAGDPSRSSQWSRGGVSHKSQDPLELAKYYRYMTSGIKSLSIVKVY